MSVEDAVLVTGMKCAILVHLSTMTSICVKPFDVGRSVIKSTVIVFHGPSGISLG